MPPRLNRLIAASQRHQLRQSLPQLIRRMDAVANGRTTPSLDMMPIASGRKVRAGVIFFDISGFTLRTGSDDPEALKKTLLLLNCTLPAMMRVLYRHNAYVEKNTGDGLMAVLGIESSDETTAADALNAAEEMMRVLHYIVNPELAAIGIEPVNARIGMDMGSILITRIGLPNGSASHPRNSLTAVGPAANLASKLQGMAGVNEIWCGDSICRNASAERQPQLDCVTPEDWPWSYGGNPNNRYHCWRFNGDATDPFATIIGGSAPGWR